MSETIARAQTVVKHPDKYGSKHFKIHELEPRPNDLSSTQEIQAGGFMAQLSGRCRSGNMSSNLSRESQWM
jgi:hypothetical protein